MPDGKILSEQDRTKLGGIVQKMAENNESEDNIQTVVNGFKDKYGVLEGEKKSLVSTTPDTKSASGIGTGSSVLSETNPFGNKPIAGKLPDGSGLKISTAKSVVPKKQVKTVKHEQGFMDHAANSLLSGLDTTTKSILDAPELIHDALITPQNYIADKFNIPALRAENSDELTKKYGLKNIPSQYLKERIETTDKKIQAYSDKNGGDVLSALENGDIGHAAKLAVGSTLQSLPLMALAMATGGESLAANTAIGASAASTKYQDLKNNHPELSQNKKISNAVIEGVAEGTIGHFMDGISGNVIKGIAGKHGVSEGAKILSKSFKKSLEEFVGKNPITGMVGEFAEEAITDALEQGNDMNSGIQKDFDVRRALNAGLSSLGMSGPTTAYVYGAKAYMGAKDYKQVKEVNKQIGVLQSKMQDENTDEETKKVIATSLDNLVAENKRVLGEHMEKLKSIPKEQKAELNALNAKIEEHKDKAETIKSDNSLDDTTKQTLLDQLKVEFKKDSNRKTEILSGAKTPEGADYSNFEGVHHDYNIEGDHDSQLHTAAAREQYDAARNGLPPVPDNYDIVSEPITETQQPENNNQVSSDRNTELFPDTSDFGDVIGGSGTTANLSSYREVNGVGVTEYTNPDNGLVDVYMSGTSDHDYVGYVRVYENGQPTNRFTSKMENKSKNKADFKTMITEIQSRLPENHEYTEKTSVSTDGINVFAQQLNHGYEIATDENGNPITNLVAINGDSRVNDLGIDVQAGSFDNISVTDNKSFDKVKKALLPFIEKLGLTENDIIWEDGTVKINLPVLRKTNTKSENNAPVQRTDNAIDGDIRPTVGVLGEDRVAQPEVVTEEDSQPAVISGETEGTVREPEQRKPVNQKIKLTEKGQPFVVREKDGILEVRKEDGSQVSAPTRRAVLRAYAENVDFSTGERAIDRSDFSGDMDAYEREVAEKSSNPAEVAEAAVYAESFLEGQPAEHTVDHKQSVIADGIDKIKESGFNSFDDRNNASKSIRKNYFDENGRDIDDLAAELSERAGVEITPQDIADFIKEHPKGVKEFEQKNKKATEEAKSKAYEGIDALKEAFTKLTGLPASAEYLHKAIAQKNRKHELNSTLDNMSDEEFQRHYDEYQKLEQEEHGTKETESVTEGSDESENDGDGRQEPEIQSEPDGTSRGEKRKKIADANVDELADWLKQKLKVNVDTEGLRTNGISQDDLIDFIAESAKKVAHAGIDIHEAITQVIDALGEKFELDIDAQTVIDKHFTEEETETEETPEPKNSDFEKKQGKKSLLGRLTTGGNETKITNALKELNPNYDVRNQESADADAIAFVDTVGSAEAIQAVRDGKIKNADTKMLIYNEALTRLKDEMSDEISRSPEDQDALIEKFQELSTEFDNMARDMGQGIAILNYIYNKNQSLKYNLTKLIDDYKRADVNGEIPADVKAKFQELTEKLKDVEAREKDAQERAKKAEDALAVKNIQESIEREKANEAKTKSGLTKQEESRKAELRNKFLGRFNDVSSIATMIADPEFLEYNGLIFKTAKGDFENFAKQMIKELGKGVRKYLPELYEKAGGKGEANLTELSKSEITVDKEGKLKIPNQLIRDYVEAGETEIDAISQMILEDVQELFPDGDFDLRDVRDAITNYGKQVNKTEDTIQAEISKMKEYGRLISAYEDVMSGKMPFKSGLKREKPETRARQLRKEINRLAKELGLDTIDPETQWANALAKVKSHLENQITDLNEQIANGEKRKVERTATVLDAEAENLKAERDALKKQLDDMVGKPELTDEQKIQKAEKLLESSIKKLQEQIDSNDIEHKEKPTPVTSAKIERLKAEKKALLETRKQLREDAGITEAQKLRTAKTRVRTQIDQLNEKLRNKDFSKKEVKPILADSELNQLRAEKEAIYEEFEKQKYIQELANRSWQKKLADSAMEFFGLARAIKASLDLGLVGIQLRGLTYSELWRNPAELGRKFWKLFGAIGSQSKTNKAMATLIGHPLYNLAKKMDIGMTHPDLRDEVREEMAAGSMLHFIWNSPMMVGNKLTGGKLSGAKKNSIGDTFIKAFNKNHQPSGQFTAAEQLSNVNVFSAVERGLSTFGNQLRFEEFVRGVERLRVEGKDEINHVEDYKLLAEYIRTFTGRANPAGMKMNQKALNLFFFSFKNATSVFQQLNPVWWGRLHVKSTDFQNGNYTKPSVAQKMAMATMFKSVASTAATILFVMAGYNAFKDDDEEEMTLERDPRSSDFGKIKHGSMRYDPWGGYVPLITLYARLITEEAKKSNGDIYTLGANRNGIQSRLDATARFLFNKEAPLTQMLHHYLISKEKVNKKTGETTRVTPFGGKLAEDEAYSMYPIFIKSVKDCAESDPDGVKVFLTAYSVLGLGNVQDYESSGSGKKKKPKKKS